MTTAKLKSLKAKHREIMKKRKQTERQLMKVDARLEILEEESQYQSNLMYTLEGIFDTYTAQLEKIEAQLDGRK